MMLTCVIVTKYNLMLFLMVNHSLFLFRVTVLGKWHCRISSPSLPTPQSNWECWVMILSCKSRAKLAFPCPLLIKTPRVFAYCACSCQPGDTSGSSMGMGRCTSIAGVCLVGTITLSPYKLVFARKGKVELKLDLLKVKLQTVL